MITHRILEAISKNITDNENKAEILQIIKDLLKKKYNCYDAFFDIYKYIGNDIKKLFNIVAPFVFIYYSDNQCCSLIWKVDKYIDTDGKTIIVPSRCSRNRIDNSSLYCRTHNNPKSIEFCKLCSKNMEEPIYHSRNWEHFGNIFQLHLSPCFNDKNIENCYRQNYSKTTDNLKCVSYAEFIIEKNKNKWISYQKETIIKHDISNIKFNSMQKLEKDIVIPKKKTKNTNKLVEQLKLPVVKNSNIYINLDDELRSILWCLLLNHIFNKNPKIEKSISPITIFDKENVLLYTNDKFIYNTNFKIEGILLNNDIAVFKDDLQNYVNSIDISKIDEKLLKVFIKELLQ